MITYFPRKHAHKEFGITSRRRRYFYYYVTFPIYYFQTRQYISLMWRHACLFCFWAFFIPLLVHQGILNRCSCRIRDLNISFCSELAVHLAAGCYSLLYPQTPDLQGLHQSHSFLSVWRTLSPSEFRTLLVPGFLLQADATQQSAIIGSLLCLLAWGPYLLLRFGLCPVTHILTKLPVELYRVGGWRGSHR